MTARTLLAPLLLVALGVLVAVLAPGTAGRAAAIVLVGVGCVVAVSLVFWRIGQGEDEERRRR